jgi:hypothetical protein
MTMKTRGNATKGCGFVLALLMAWGLSACERSEQGDAITVTPAVTTLEGPSATVLTASPAEDGVVSSNRVEALYLPLTWWVSDPELGNITASGGYTAVYSSTTKEGQNTVFVSDEVGAEGNAVIIQRAP